MTHAAPECMDGLLVIITYQSIIKATFLLYRSAPTGMMTACGEMGAVSII